MRGDIRDAANSVLCSDIPVLQDILMNITLIKLKGVVIALNAICTQLTRLADCWEVELAQTGVHMKPPKADTSGPEPTVQYTEEDMDWARENIERLKQEDRLLAEQEE